jgi:hypothetical protein
MQSPPGTNVPPPPELRRSWVIAALGGAVAAGVMATLFVVLAPPPPHRTIVLPDAAPRPEAAAAPSSPAARLSVSISPVHDWPEVTGMDRTAAKATLEQHELAIRKCNHEPPPEDEEVARPGVQVQLTIKADGTVGGVDIVENDVADPEFPACIEKVLRKIQFRPKPGKEASVTMLWTF